MMTNPAHPGEILREDVIRELGLTVTDAAARLDPASTPTSGSPPASIDNSKACGRPATSGSRATVVRLNGFLTEESL